MFPLWPVWATVEGFWEECTPPNGHYPFDLGPCQENLGGWTRIKFESSRFLFGQAAMQRG